MITNIKRKTIVTLSTLLLASCGGEVAVNEEKSLCDELNGNEYLSEALYESGLTPDGVAMGHWLVSFNDGEVMTRQSDYREAGSYSCEGSRVIAEFSEGETLLQLSADLSYLYNHPSTNQKVTYKKRSTGDQANPELCSSVAGKSYVNPDTIPTGGPADAQLAAEYVRFSDDAGTASINLAGNSIAEAFYDCEFSELHIHTDADDQTPYTATLDGSTLTATVGDQKISMIESGSEGEYCAEIYAPVCSATPIQCVTEPCDDGVYETYGNLCSSDNAGAVFQFDGECGDQEGAPWNEDEQVFCPLNYDPICGVNTGIACITEPCPDGVYKTYGNQCELDAAKAIEQFPGECGELEGQPWDDQVVCPAVYQPVCGINTNVACVTEPCPEGVYRTYSNDCVLAAEDGLFQFEDECGEMEGQVWSSEEPVACTKEYAPVCGGVLSTEVCTSLPCPKMTHETFSNNCMLEAEGATKLFEGECGDKEDTPVTEIEGECTLDYNPVCGKKETGIVCITEPCESAEYKTYGNFCAANLARAQQVFTGECGALDGEVTTNEPAVFMVPEYPTFPAGRSPTITKAEITGDILTLGFSYSGCETVHYDVYISSSFAESLPVQTTAVLVPMGDPGGCEPAPANYDVRFDLLPLKHTYMEAYQSKSGEINLHVDEQTVNYSF